MKDTVIRCVLSGTYRKERAGLLSAYRELVTCGCQVLSPHRLEFDQQDVLFVRDAAEAEISEETIEKHHLLSIKQSDFLWLHAPSGYIGVSSAFEVGYAVAHKVPVFATEAIVDSGLSSFVNVVPSVFKAIESLSK